jgi:hypothetical protein
MANTIDLAKLKGGALKALKDSKLDKKEVYATADGNIFFDKGVAKLHADKSKQDLHTFEVEDDKPAAAKAESAKAEAKPKAETKPSAKPKPEVKPEGEAGADAANAKAGEAAPEEGK